MCASDWPKPQRVVKRARFDRVVNPVVLPYCESGAAEIEPRRTEKNSLDGSGVVSDIADGQLRQIHTLDPHIS